jgi:hypothetical protein
MSHMTSAATLKGNNKGRLLKDKPREGTRTRRIYDMFYDNKGKVIDFCTTKNPDAVIIPQLTDVYGLDIRRIRKNKWCLVGEWFGKVYVDYTQP